MLTHYYPTELAQALQQRWPVEAPPLPPVAVLTTFISVLYQASLLTEEGQPVRCRAVLAPGTQLFGQARELTDFYALTFAESRAWNEQEVRRLSPAVLPATSLLAVAATAGEVLSLWGLVFGAHQWDQEPARAVPGGRTAPDALLVHVSDPGSLAFYYGATRVLTLQRGRIEGHGFLQFPWAWSAGRFLENRPLAGTTPALSWTPVQDDCVAQLVVQMQRWALTQARGSGHGVLMVFVPTARVAELLAPGDLLRPKYPLLPPPEGARFTTLVLAIVDRLHELGEVSWAAYQQQAHDAELRRLTLELDRFGDDIAALGAVDGALVFTHQLAVVGFGVEIQATQVPLSQVYRALDLTGTSRQAVPADQGGTRHRAAYRLCLAAPDCLAVVVSQDGGVQFVHNQRGDIVFWDQLSF